MRRVKNKVSRKVVGTPQPPQFMPSMRVDKPFRFTATAAAVGTAITFRNLLETWVNTPTAVTANLMGLAVRLRRIEIWAGPSSSLAPVTVAIDWSGATLGVTGNNSRMSDTSVGSTRVAHLAVHPPISSQAAQWQANTNNNAFTIDCPAGAIIDLHLSYLIRDDGTAVAATNAPVGATPGANYLRSFDGLATAAGNFVPTSYPQI